MFEFSTQEKQLLEKIGLSGSGREFIHLLKKMRADIDRTSNIPEDSDYGAEVKGRAITTRIINKLISSMEKTPRSDFKDTEDLDNVD